MYRHVHFIEFQIQIECSLKFRLFVHLDLKQEYWLCNSETTFFCPEVSLKFIECSSHRFLSYVTYF